MPPGSLLDGEATPRSILTTAERESINQSINEDYLQDTAGTADVMIAPKKSKKVRLLLDARTELTDEELKVSSLVNSSCQVVDYSL